MAKNVDFFFDFVSPTSYLAWTQLPAICEKYGAALSYHPILLGGIFKATGNQTPITISAKRTWLFADIARYSASYGIAFNMNPHFPLNSITMMRGACWAKNNGVFDAYAKAMFEGMWVNGKDMGDADTIAQLANDAGLDGKSMLAETQNAVIKQSLIAETDAAVSRGVFGVPTMIVDDETHFGQDRLQWVEKALQR